MPYEYHVVACDLPRGAILWVFPRSFGKMNE